MNDFDCEHWMDAEINLPYFKQGDDINHYIDECNTIEEALERHAQTMDSAASQLRAIRSLTTGKHVCISGCTHMIRIEAEPEIIAQLVSDGVANLPEHVEDSDEDESPAVSDAPAFVIYDNGKSSSRKQVEPDSNVVAKEFPKPSDDMRSANQRTEYTTFFYEPIIQNGIATGPYRVCRNMQYIRCIGSEVPWEVEVPSREAAIDWFRTMSGRNSL